MAIQVIKLCLRKSPPKQTHVEGYDHGETHKIPIIILRQDECDYTDVEPEEMGNQAVKTLVEGYDYGKILQGKVPIVIAKWTMDDKMEETREELD